jgi:ATP-dependent helicase HrpA
LRRQGDVIKLTLLKSFEESKTANSLGVEQLIKHELRRELAWIREDLKDFSKLGPIAIAFAPLDRLKEQAYSHIKKHLCTHNMNTISVTDIQNKIESAKSQSRGLVYNLIDLLQEILGNRQELKVRKDLPADLDREIDRLLPTDFLEKTPHWALNRLPIYLQSLLVRLQSRIRDPERDAARQGEIDRLRNQLAASKVGSSQYSDIAWTIEEYALSLFAQSLGTAFPVSEKRILQKLKETPGEDPSKPSNSATTSTKPNCAIDRPTSSDLESLKSLFGQR